MDQKFGPSDAEISDAYNLNKKLDQAGADTGKTNSQIISDIISQQEMQSLEIGSRDYKAFQKESEQIKESMNQRADFYLHEWQEKTGNRSHDMETVFKNLECQTFGDLGWGRLQKSLLGFEIGDRRESSGNASQSTVYLGASTDIHFPLAMRARNITLVDPGFAESPEMIDALKEEIAKYGEYQLKQSEEGWSATFQVDFGKGKEEVRLTVCPVGAETYEPDQPVGTLLSFKGNGYTTPFSFPRIDSHLAEGAYIYDSDYAGFASEIVADISARKGDYSAFSGAETREYQERTGQAAANFGLKTIFIPGLEQPVYQLEADISRITAYAEECQAKREERNSGGPDLSELREFIKSAPPGSLLPDQDEE